MSYRNSPPPNQSRRLLQLDGPCARCTRPVDPATGWRLTGWRICDRQACVRSASHGLLRGMAPDCPQELDDAAVVSIAEFDKRMYANRPAPPPWAKARR